ncbi:hypothetical protein SARC_05692 [Sphaeroforma arctica JP610]|uniref:Uncharacterized protein n=1 Tax=Sphaeroforma arctica JP610 TaxID=667725 RepID=A0A0L0FZF1_9EUKA|nr:hypothetical protein SARC_05692 [Sphaeroforma arctica JP610]KNC82009.1 hypothetical protein SARC_05692 [Sphaeroforma arctica JP610]|eukprot:XP_014155911.1 hypothetical protein SARC_05692 [Sphaeroforma arctica JP610]
MSQLRNRVRTETEFKLVVRIKARDARERFVAKRVCVDVDEEYVDATSTESESDDLLEPSRPSNSNRRFGRTRKCATGSQIIGDKKQESSDSEENKVE